MKDAKKVHTDKFVCLFLLCSLVSKINTRTARIKSTVSFCRSVLIERMRMGKKILTVILVAVLLLSACASPEVIQSPGRETEKVEATKNGYKIAYLCSDASSLRYKHIAEGIKNACDSLKVDYLFVDCKERDDLFLSFLKDIEKSNLDALIVSPTNEGLGPMVTNKCTEIGIPLLSIESRLKTTEGKNAAYIGAAAYDCGMMGGRELASRAIQRGFFESDRPVTVISLSRSNFFYEDQMMQGFRDAFDTLLPKLRAENYFTLETFHPFFKSQYQDIKNRLNKLDTNNRYIGVSYNDDGALALYRFALESGMNMNDVLICGMGGYEPSYAIFSSGGINAKSYVSVGVDPFTLGSKAATSIYSYLYKDELYPEIQTVAAVLLTADNYKEYFSKVYKDRINTDTAEEYGWKIDQ
jgi:ABC-type sugar transport system substrate-binding protein